MNDETLELEECESCGTEHGPEDGCETVLCCDCGCQHYGTFDNCDCKTAYCDECQCEPEEYWEDGSGCAACHWQYTQTGNVDPCNYGDESLGYDECAYYTSWLHQQNGPAPKNQLFSVRHLEGVEPHEVTADGEHSVALQLGLDPHMDLSQACADFYLLERLYYNSHDLAQRYDPKAGKTRLEPSLPMDFGRDTKAERLAMAIGRTRAMLNRELSKQLLTYMIMAVGGELRHAPGMAHHCKRVRGTPKKLWPKLKAHKGWREFPSYADGYKDESPARIKALYLRWYGCAACIQYVRHIKRVNGMVYAMSVTPCNRSYWTVDKHGNEKRRTRPSTQANPNCGYFEWWAEKHKLKVGGEKVISFNPDTERLQEFFDSRRFEENHRGLAWREWLKLYSHYGPVLLQDCERVFLKWHWCNGYGGKKWGEATHFALLYAAGKMSDSAFLDRVWTLEHNGGNLFNKFYTKGVGDLRRVLDVQAKDKADYPKLIRHASRYTQELYREAEREGVLNRQPSIVWG